MDYTYLLVYTTLGNSRADLLVDETKSDLASDTDLLSVLINTFLHNSLDLLAINGLGARIHIFKSRT